MKIISQTSQFKKDVKRMKKRGKDFKEFKEVIEKLTSGQKLELKYQEHRLVGEYRGMQECHIASDWLLIYELSESEIMLIRTGTHADLFK